MSALTSWLTEPTSGLAPERLATVAKGLAHPARAAIVIQLCGSSELTAGEIVATSGLAQSTVSEHLRVLRRADLVACRRDGPRVWYRLERPVLSELATALQQLSS